MRLTAVAALSAFAAWSGPAEGKPVPLIVDTDIGGGGCNDVDDVVALCMSNALVKTGEVDLLAVVLNTAPVHCAGAICCT